MKNQFGLIVRFDIKPGCADAFSLLVETTLEQVRQQEPQTLQYCCHQVVGEPNTWIFYELYANRQAFEYHEQQEHVQHFLSERERYLASRPRVEFLSAPMGT